jgi:hypothetical protein
MPLEGRERVPEDPPRSEVMLAAGMDERDRPASIPEAVTDAYVRSRAADAGRSRRLPAWTTPRGS